MNVRLGVAMFQLGCAMSLAALPLGVALQSGAVMFWVALAGVVAVCAGLASVLSGPG